MKFRKHTDYAFRWQKLQGSLDVFCVTQPCRVLRAGRCLSNIHVNTAIKAAFFDTGSTQEGQHGTREKAKGRNIMLPAFVILKDSLSFSVNNKSARGKQNKTNKHKLKIKGGVLESINTFFFFSKTSLIKTQFLSSYLHILFSKYHKYLNK